jgi:hypothetical protein
VSGDPPLIVLRESARPLLEAARTVLATPDLPPVVIIGGLAVTVRVSAAGTAHRATVDIDLVTVDAEPEAVEVLADAHDTSKPTLIIGEVRSISSRRARSRTTTSTGSKTGTGSSWPRTAGPSRKGAPPA